MTKIDLNLKFDHIVHFVNKPEEMVNELEVIGLHVAQGGKHENSGTYNSLAYFDLSYIEYLGVYDPERFQTPKHGLLETIENHNFSEGLYQIALRTNQIEALAAHLIEQGLEVVGPTEYSRRRPDGSLVKWKLVFASQRDGASTLPFFIEWNESDDVRREELILKGTISQHKSGPLRLGHVTFVVSDLNKTVQNWKDWFGLKFEEAVYDEYFKGTKQSAPLGDTVLNFIKLDQESEKDTLFPQGLDMPFVIGLQGTEEGEKYIQLHNALYHLY